jgi:hypothetical protein
VGKEDDVLGDSHFVLSTAGSAWRRCYHLCFYHEIIATSAMEFRVNLFQLFL